MRLYRQTGGLLAVATMLFSAEVRGQYAPYSPQQYQQIHGQQSAYGQPPASGQQQAYPQYQPASGYGQPGPVYGTSRPVQYRQPAQPRYAMAAQNEDLPLSAPAENVSPGAPQSANGNGYPPLQPTPAVTQEYGGYVPGAAAGAGCNCQTPAATPSMYDNYGASGCQTGADGGYAGYGGCDTCGTYSTYGCGYGQGGGYGSRIGGMMRGRGCNYWFGGVYGLLMERDRGDKVPLAFAASGLATGAYPTSSSVVLNTRNVDIGYQPGVEFRLGRTFGGQYDPCTCCCSQPCWGLEGVYWTIFDDDASASYVQSGTLRVYSMMDFRGLEYDPGTGYRPLNHYFDYAPPVSDYSNGGALDNIRIDLARVRSSFEVQNVEVNLLRLPLAGGGQACCGVAAAGCDSGCNPCGGCDPCAGSCGYGGGCGSRFSVVTLCGFRYMQFDESFMYGVNFTNTVTSATGFMNYNSQVTNDLYGFQLGSNGMYRIGCKWGVHLGATCGLYGNDIDVRQYFNSPTGMVRYIGDPTNNFDVMASKNDVAMIGELRLGASYQYSCHCRLYGGWRAVGVTGIALATDQVPGAFIDAAQMASYVNSNGSLILHGMQAGVEWNY